MTISAQSRMGPFRAHLLKVLDGAEAEGRMKKAEGGVKQTSPEKKNFLFFLSWFRS